MTFQLGDKVEWRVPRGQIWGHRGTVVGVVPAGTMPYECGIEPPYTMLRLPCETACPRKHESYLVHVAGTGRGAGKLYWPRVSGLRKVGESEESPK